MIEHLLMITLWLMPLWLWGLYKFSLLKQNCSTCKHDKDFYCDSENICYEGERWEWEGFKKWRVKK
jgi:hypothetical protein